MNFQPMLASATDGKGLTYPLIVSPKLDGIRCTIIEGVAMSRKLKPIPNIHVQKLLGKRRYNGLDGELIVGEPTAKDCYRKTSSAVMSRKGEPDFRFHIFDDYRAEGGFRKRLERCYEREPVLNYMSVLDHELVDREEDFFDIEKRYLRDGYEGIMIRAIDGPYKYGRSTEREGWLLKLKRFVDSEATVLDWTPLMHNANEATPDERGYSKRSSHKENKVAMPLLGALLVRDVKTGVEFEIGTGFTEDERRKLWRYSSTLKSKLVKYKYLPVGVKDKPRHPVFLGFRDVRDL